MTALDVDLNTLLDLDFAASIPCEHRQHPTKHQPDAPAIWDVRIRCPECGRTAHYQLCDIGKKWFEPPHTIGCIWCGKTGHWKDFVVACHPIPET